MVRDELEVELFVATSRQVIGPDQGLDVTVELGLGILRAQEVVSNHGHVEEVGAWRKPRNSTREIVVGIVSLAVVVCRHGKIGQAGVRLQRRAGRDENMFAGVLDLAEDTQLLIVQVEDGELGGVRCDSKDEVIGLNDSLHTSVDVLDGHGDTGVRADRTDGLAVVVDLVA